MGLVGTPSSIELTVQNMTPFTTGIHSNGAALQLFNAYSANNDSVSITIIREQRIVRFWFVICASYILVERIEPTMGGTNPMQTKLATCPWK